MESPIAAKDFEAKINSENSVLLKLWWPPKGFASENLIEGFCGSVISIDSTETAIPSFDKKTVYLSGDISKARDLNFDKADRVFVIRELSCNYNKDDGWPVVSAGRLPILVHGVGVLHRQFFDPDQSYFRRIHSEHAFQTLTESTKPNNAHRSGIYLTPVEKKDDELHFHLLRCSSNFSGPTLNFGATDHDVVDALNRESTCLFDNAAPLNHVLAQVYHNRPGMAGRKETKAKIKDHADKTKDMPPNGIMAFCTFYDHLDKLKRISTDPFDYCYKKTSALTTLEFRLKYQIADRPEYCHLNPRFSVKLYPESVFFMPLSTNRLYTHEIRPSTLQASQLPTRMGYVVRCSATPAIHRDGKTLIKKGDGFVELEQPTTDGMKELRKMYAKENSTDDFLDYGDKFLFSMNMGDYMKPVCGTDNDFQCFREVLSGQNLFEKLLASAPFEEAGKGCQGAVLVQPHPTRGVPIVRTTTKYKNPAQCFCSVHVALAQEVQAMADLPIAFNNALIEHYSNAYAKMGFHSDQALDLKDGSHIALFSCYKYPDLANPPPRKLVVESKEGGGSFEIPLDHNSVVVFSLETNQRFRHKIVLDPSLAMPENQWLGVTFRTSKTFLQLRDGNAYFESGESLELATDEQRREFYKLRGRENGETDFEYPPVGFTISASDLMEPTPPQSGK